MAPGPWVPWARHGSSHAAPTGLTSRHTRALGFTQAAAAPHGADISRVPWSREMGDGRSSGSSRSILILPGQVLSYIISSDSQVPEMDGNSSSRLLVISNSLVTRGKPESLILWQQQQHTALLRSGNATTTASPNCRCNLSYVNHGIYVICS